MTLADIQDNRLGAQSAPDLRIFNVKYSPNLGDGLLSECLESALIDCGAAPCTRSVDLAARTQYSQGSSGRSLKLRVVEALPGFIRPWAVRLPLAIMSKRSWAPHYREELVGADCAIIGGGNLLADLDLNFPTKLSLAIASAAEAQIPAVIYGCGMSSGWSKKGRALMQAALDTGTVRAVFLRDERSKKLWDEMFGRRNNLIAQIVRDPGLLASDVYNFKNEQEPTTSNAKAPVGINITSPIAVKYHSSNAPSSQMLENFYVDMAQALLARGENLVIFTNGSPEDRATLEDLRPRFDALAIELGSKRISFTNPNDPAQLVQIIAQLKGVAAFRMHAIIAAFSLGVPFMGLAWDPKLESFLQSVGMAENICQLSQSDVGAAIDILDNAIAAGFDKVSHQAVLDEARKDVARLFRVIEQL